METCKYGLGASTRKPPTARWVWRWVLSPHNEEQDVKNILVLRNTFEKTRKQMKANTLSINVLSNNLNFPMFAEITLKKT
ncbi:hypothetical protein INE88_02405 [Bacteroides eggerthii]|uniref:Uncharacterized protein n=3 Tax=Bacteroides TaxID=816 RepID=A0A975KG46_9BACE|nr:hypothetical protein INE88_00002 [Bacteroides eggerthii]QUT45583.1 hypothetical protein INE88_02405 [Bacteroides eggerthii]